MCVFFLELGLNRKSIKSSQSSIDVIEAIATEFVDSMSVYCFLRASVVKGKALLGSGKANEAVAAWSSAVSKAVQFGWNVVVDVSLLMELNNLIEQHRVVSSAGTDKPLSVDVPPTSEPGCKQDADTQPSPAASSPTSPATPTAAAAGQQPTIKKSPVKSDAPTSASLPSPPPTLATTTAATTSETSTTTTKASRAADADAAALLAAKEIYRSAMMAIHRRSIGDGDEHAIKPIYLTAIRANLPHICGEPLVDDLICLSYINVNSGNLETASSIFKLLNEYRNDLPAALIGVGSISAMQRNFDDAIAQFTKALNIDDTIADAWKRRGQTRAAKGLVKTALKDLTKAISLIPGDADCYNQRGLIYHQSRNYTRALADFQAAQTRGLSSATLLNNIGMCEGQLGCVKPSIESHLRAIKLEPLFKEAHLNIALMHKESGDWVNALTAFEGAIKCDTKNPFFQAYGHRGLMYAQLGRPGAALKDLLLAINVLFSIVKSADNGTTAVVHTADERATRRTELVLNLIRAAMCYQQLGQYHKSTGFLDQALSLHPGHTCWFQKEIGLFLWTGVDVELSLYNLDDRTDPRLKDGWCKHSTFDYMVPHRIGANAAATIRPLPPSPPGVPAAPLGTGCYGLQRKPASTPVLYRYSDAIPVDEDGEQIPSAVGAAGVRTASTSTVAGSGSSSAVPKKNRSAYDPQEGTVQSMRDEALKLRLVELTKPMSRWIQLDSPGFLPNRRQHRMFGVAVLQMAAALTRHLSLISLEGIGLLVPDAVSSRASPRSGSKATSQPALTSATAAGSAVQNTPKKAVSSSAAAKLAGGAAKSSTGSSSSSSSSSRGESPSGKRGATRTHTFNWRDLYDIAVRWRQVSEPGDPVWWIDRFPTQAFEDGFGLQTPLVNGHLTTVRYAPYFQPAFDRVKEILQQQGYYTASDQFVSLGPEDRRLVAAARTLTELRAAVGRNFYVVVPCPSLREPPRGSAPALILEGTRLTLLAQEPEGFDFTIRTPGMNVYIFLTVW